MTNFRLRQDLTVGKAVTHTLTIHLTAQAFSRLQRQAEAAGTSPAELVAASLERPCKTNRPALTDVETASARQRFERHFGELDLGYPTGTDNDAIDTDLAAEYAGPIRAT